VRTRAAYLHDTELFEAECTEEEVAHFSNIDFFIQIGNEENDRVILR